MDKELTKILTEFQVQIMRWSNGDIKDSRPAFYKTRDAISILIQREVRAARQDIKGWIEHNHLGKGFDGNDRWEQVSAEIIMYLEELENE